MAITRIGYDQHLAAAMALRLRVMTVDVVDFGFIEQFALVTLVSRLRTSVTRRRFFLKALGTLGGGV